LRLSKILFTQLPRLENDVGGKAENFPMATIYLNYALDRQSGDRSYERRFLTFEEEQLDDRHLLELILSWNPDAICSTLYLWNIERTLALLKKVRQLAPGIRIVLGGPEVAPKHPFLFRSKVADAAVSGEGESVVPQILRALDAGAGVDVARVAWKAGGRYHWGRIPTAPLGLKEALAPPDHFLWKPDENGIAYLETGRGCPMKCSYCRYSMSRAKGDYLSPEDVEARIRVLIERGAREIRFVDPTFNAHPAFRQILEGLGRLRIASNIRFFAELQVQWLEPLDIELLAMARFSEIEIGVQSLDPAVLRRIHRPPRLRRVEENLKRLADSGIGVTIDFMYGLPGQDQEDVHRCLEWAKRFKGANVQCLQTLLLPGTELRRTRRRWKIISDNLPPYGVRSTATLSTEDILDIEETISKKARTDAMTQRFVGHFLPDLFEERILLQMEELEKEISLQGSTARRALIFRGNNLFQRRQRILSAISAAIRSEPHILYQFVLNPKGEEPLDLIEAMIVAVRNHGRLWLDRFACVSGWDRLASRRVFVLLNRSGQYTKPWIRAAETLLQDHFY
jgi:radical SAM superfamily enzyme YgiQ (UPF0313 family)